MKRTHGEEDDDDDHPSKRARIEAPPPMVEVEGPSYFDVTCADVRALVRRQLNWKERTLLARTCKQAHHEECFPLLPLMTFLRRTAELTGLDIRVLHAIYNRWLSFAPRREVPLRFCESNQPTAVYAVHFSAGTGTAMHLQVFPCVWTEEGTMPTPQAYDAVLHMRCGADPYDITVSYVHDPFAGSTPWTYISRMDVDSERITGYIPGPSRPVSLLSLLMPILDLRIPRESSDDEGHDDHA